jgi:hypothetical protein
LLDSLLLPLLATRHLQGKFQSNGWSGKQDKKTNPGFWKILLLCHIPSTGGDALSQMGKNFLKVQTAHANLNVVPNILLSQRKTTSVLRHGLTFALGLSYSPANLVSVIHIGQRKTSLYPACKLQLLLMTLNLSQGIKAMLAVGCTSVNLP